MCIDVHTHHLPAAYMDMLHEGGGPTFGAAHDESVLHKMIDGQEEVGIRCQIISTGPNSPYLRDRAQAVAAARTVNDAYKAVVDRYEGRFAAFGSAPLPHADAAAAEAVRCLDELQFVGMHFGCSALGHALDSPAFADMWTELDRREAIIYIHPGGILCGTEPGLSGMDDAGIAVTIGSAAELATAALRMAALCRTHRRLRVIIGLLGGSLPFLLGRVVWLGERFKGRSLLAAESPNGSLIAELRRFSYDTNLLPDPKVIGFAREAYGLDRLLFGSDAPGMAPQVTARFMRDGGLTEDEFAEISVHNPGRLFGQRLADQPLDQTTH
ncbi:amidohydrolase family protein [Lichenicoccus sp.]|uniref:amidohydrolase family protein n=1 Tax=Lichenicoccus sp. TaxID=2781899 RepID=UPI003D11123F